MAASVAQELKEQTAVRWWSIEEDSSRKQLPPSLARVQGAVLYVIDGLHHLKDSEVDKTFIAGIADFIDQCSMHRIPVLATGRDLADETVQVLTKAGRLELIVEMHAPDQEQRETMLRNWFPEWAKGLATLTAGFVADDLNRLHQQVTKGTHEVTWSSLCAAALSIVPSQLSALDVQKPDYLFESMLEQSGAADWKRHHFMCFERMGGYDDMKRRLYRTVVVPWRRALTRTTPAHDEVRLDSPPAGVLFYGPR